MTKPLPPPLPPCFPLLPRFFSKKTKQNQLKPVLVLLFLCILLFALLSLAALFGDHVAEVFLEALAFSALRFLGCFVLLLDGFAREAVRL